MRKLFLAVALVALSVPTIASADVCLPHWRSEQLKFRTHANGTVYDSTFYSAGTGAVPNADTTAAFSLYDVAFESPTQAGPAGVDSINIMTLHIIPRSGVNAPSVTSDSLYITPQVSMDGRSWQTMTPTRDFVASKVVGSATITNGTIVLEATSGLDTYTIAWKQAHSEVLGWYSAYEATAASTLQWFGWRFVRWIVVSDAVGAFEAHLAHRSQACND